tara:strand:+ start:57 stop:581 length:525 start_codon:yes stop_codon:yes gene_type:complete
MKEIWKSLSKEAFGEVAHYYEVSNIGRVRSITRIDISGRTRYGKILKLFLNKGYPLFSACKDNNRRRVKVHQAVYYSFKGGSANGMNYVIDHIDGEKTNNRLDNLQKISHYDNINKGTGNHGKHNLPKHVSAKPKHWNRSELIYSYQRYINGKNVVLKRSVSLDKVLMFKEEYE